MALLHLNPLTLSLSDIFNRLDCTQEKYYFKYNFVNSLTNLDRIRLLQKVGLAALHFVRTKVPSSLSVFHSETVRKVN